MQDVNEKIHEEVRSHYAAIAGKSSCCGSSCDCGPQLYDPAKLETVPSEAASISLGCGDPTAIGRIKPGETVLDLGSGGGLDCFIAARQVGPTGRVIGVDMTPEMLARATATAERMGITNVSFRSGYIEAIPVEDGTVDVIISNCVINLSPDKRQVLTEMYRVLKPGGRIAISDIVTRGPISDEYIEQPDAWSSCVSGALPTEQWSAWLAELGFERIDIYPALTTDPIDSIPYSTPFSASIRAYKGE
jgi:arsenite methyltransferase